MVFLIVKLVPIIVILLLSSQVDSWWYWWGQGRPKGHYEAAGRDYGYAEGGEHIHCFCWLPLNLKHLFQMSFSSKTLWYLVKFRVIIVPLHHQGGQGNQSIQGDQGDHDDRKVKSR